ncbi:MAG: V-type ATP synthase subunit D [Chrysiogenales bacterium]|nr:MAG: V-type ATP synthase subunit D [Chrysiogenales bacterium]
MVLDVSPTRMELLRLKKRLAIAIRGHKLLKDKLDELIRNLLALIREASDLAGEIDRRIRGTRRDLAVARHSFFPEALSAALAAPGRPLSISIGKRQVLNVTVPLFSLSDGGPAARTHGFAQTSPGVDAALEEYRSMLEGILALAQKEKGIYLIAREIMTTRRRVNALEYILIPNVRDTIRYITMKLDEIERNTKAQLMRIKDVVRAPKAPSSAYPGTSKHPI